MWKPSICRPHQLFIRIVSYVWTLSYYGWCDSVPHAMPVIWSKLQFQICVYVRMYAQHQKLPSLWSIHKYRAVGEYTTSIWVLHFVEGKIPLCCVGVRANSAIWWFGDLDLIWVHIVPNMKHRRVHPPSTACAIPSYPNKTNYISKSSSHVVSSIYLAY